MESQWLIFYGESSKLVVQSTLASDQPPRSVTNWSGGQTIYHEQVNLSLYTIIL